MDFDRTADGPGATQDGRPGNAIYAALHKYEKPGRYTVAVKVVDIFGNDTMTLVPVNVG